MTSILVLLGFGALSFLAALPGALFPPGDWYRRLAKPAWQPPSWIFAPVWTALYAGMALSAWLVWRKAGLQGGAVPLAVYLAQLALNTAWTPLFFGLHRIGLALFDIVLLWGAVAATVALFYPIHAGAALLLVPYLAWVTFAAALNFAIWRINPRGEEGSY
jgi:tryptophan-rich sensory protein